MNEEQALVAYFKARDLLQDVIDSGHRGDKGDVVAELEEDLG